MCTLSVTSTELVKRFGPLNFIWYNPASKQFCYHSCDHYLICSWSSLLSFSVVGFRAQQKLDFYGTYTPCLCIYDGSILASQYIGQALVGFLPLLYFFLFI